MESELLEECLPQGPLGSLRPWPHKFKIFTFFHIILHCKTPENHVKSSFHDYCYRHFLSSWGGKCFGLTSNIRKITPKCSFSITFQKNSSRQKLWGKCPCPQMTSLQDCGGLLQCLQGHDPWGSQHVSTRLVERLLCLWLVSPAYSCSAERSFSALRRLKTWLRSTMTQRRLNRVMIYHVHSWSPDKT